MSQLRFFPQKYLGRYLLHLATICQLQTVIINITTVVESGLEYMFFVLQKLNLRLYITAMFIILNKFHFIEITGSF